MIISEKQKRVLRFFIKDLDALIEKDNLEDVLTAIFVVTGKYGFTRDNEHLNIIGKKLDKLYDEILEQNRNS